MYHKLKTCILFQWSKSSHQIPSWWHSIWHMSDQQNKIHERKELNNEYRENSRRRGDVLIYYPLFPLKSINLYHHHKVWWLSTSSWWWLGYYFLQQIRNLVGNPKHVLLISTTAINSHDMDFEIQRNKITKFSCDDFLVLTTSFLSPHDDEVTQQDSLWCYGDSCNHHDIMMSILREKKWSHETWSWWLCYTKNPLNYIFITSSSLLSEFWLPSSELQISLPFSH